MTAPALCLAQLAAVTPATRVPSYAVEAARIGIVHFGPGAFHRAHQAYYLERLLESDSRWAIAAISLKSTAVQAALAPQDWLYTLAELGERVQVRVIGALREVLVGSAQREATFARLTARTTRFVTLTVTEKGYCLNGCGELDVTHPDILHDWQAPAQPQSAIGWLVEALRRRRELGAAPFAVVSCDNLPDNGRALRAATVAFAAHLDPGLARWLEAEVAFPRTMVDSITPASDALLRARVEAATGLADAWPVQREPFTQWVIEDLPAMRAADWSSVGVTLTSDVSAYDRAKLRLLNGAHSTLAYLGLLRGHETVAEAMRDQRLACFVERLMREDVAPTLDNALDLNVPAYVDAVLSRFCNPGIRHLLSQIAWDGSKKLPVRLIGTIEAALAARRSVARLAVPLAAWMRFICRQGRSGVAIIDPLAQRLAAIAQGCGGQPAQDVAAFCALEEVFPASLTRLAAFRDALEQAYSGLGDPRAALG